MSAAAFATLLAGMFLAAPCGLNPFLPALFLAASSLLGGGTDLNAGLDFIGRPWFVAIVAAMFLAHVFSDKVFLPGDSLATPRAQRTRKQWVGVFHDLAQMLLGPLGGALLLAAVCRAFPANLFLLAPMLGLLLAALVYVGKRALRRRYVGRLGMLGNLLLSLVEDTAVAISCVAALILLRV